MWTQEFYNYIWTDDCRDGVIKQQVSLEPCYSCRDRGNFKAIFEVYTPITKEIGDLDTYYFEEQIAKQEIESWAELIGKTVNLNIEEVLSLQNKEVYHTDYFEVILDFPGLLFSDGAYTECNAIDPSVSHNNIIPLFKFDVKILDDRLTVDFADLFPRYYLSEARARLERNHWTAIWLEKYKKLDEKEIAVV